MGCPNCGREHKRSKNGPCPACYAQTYRSTVIGHDRTLLANARYAKRNPAKHLVWRHRYEERIGKRVPDLQALRRALKRLDAAVEVATERASVRGAGE